MLNVIWGRPRSVAVAVKVMPSVQLMNGNVNPLKLDGQPC